MGSAGNQKGPYIRGKHRIRLAHHEAGHAVAAEMLGYRVFSVTIVPDGRLAGSCKRAHTNGNVRADLILAAAGRATEAYLY